jgi:hypothetical protein
MKHLEHINYLPFNGAEQAHTALDIFDDILMGQAHLSLKIDGSPAIVAGRFPDGRLFISTKSFFNKEPVIYTSEAEIDKLEDKDLARKVKAVWNHGGLQDNLKGSGYVLGDYLYDETTLKKIDKEYWCQPNLLQYRFTKLPGNNEKVGVVWHTYAGDLHWEDAEGFDHTPINLGILFRPMNSAENKSADEAIEVTRAVVAGCADLLDYVGNDKEISDLFKRFLNDRIRNNLPICDPIDLGEAFEPFSQTHFDKRLADLKTDEGKQKVSQKRMEAAGRLYGYGQGASELFKITILLNELKLRFMQHFIPHTKVKAYLLMNDPTSPKLSARWCGYEETAHEGAVVAGQGYKVKFVDQQVFSHYNFQKYNKAA